MKTPKEDDIITNADESKRLPDENPSPLTAAKKNETDIKRNEPKAEKQGGNAADKGKGNARE